MFLKLHNTTNKKNFDAFQLNTDEIARSDLKKAKYIEIITKDGQKRGLIIFLI